MKSDLTLLVQEEIITMFCMITAHSPEAFGQMLIQHGNRYYRLIVVTVISHIPANVNQFRNVTLLNRSNYKYSLWSVSEF